MEKLDFRSDTVTHPTLAMRQAMFDAEVGDDVYGDDPNVNELERYCAELLRKEAALYVPTGTMGNQLAIMTHTKRGDQLITHESYHIVVHEVGAMSLLSGVFPKTIKNDNDFITRQEVLENLTTDDIHEPPTTLLSLENATGHGTVWPLEQLAELYQLSKEIGFQVHLDGARIFNAAIASDCEPWEIAQYCDSLMFCLSKGLCAPVGSMLLGTHDFIKRARKNRKILGGGMRQAGVLAAAGMVALKEMPDQLIIDHENAKYLASQLASNFPVKLSNQPQINMVFFHFTDPDFDHSAFHQHLFNNNVLINNSFSEYRLVTSHEIDKSTIDELIKIIKEFYA